MFIVVGPSSLFPTVKIAANIASSDDQTRREKEREREGEFTFEFNMIPVSRRRREWTELDGTAVSRRSVAQV